MTKVIAFTALHYGSTYLDAAIQSVAPYVNEWVFAYSPVGSHGTRTDAVCPDTEQQLQDIAVKALSQHGHDHLVWHRDTWPNEGAQRDTVFKLAPDADLIIVVDADEVWQDGAARQAIRQGLEQEYRIGHVPFIHFWKSFNLVCRDAAQPERVINPRKPHGHSYLQVPPVLHFGYAQPNSVVEYKIKVHGHIAEWRPEWWEMYRDWGAKNQYGGGGMPIDDLHPTNKNYWSTEWFDRTQLPDVLKAHPLYDVEVIR